MFILLFFFLRSGNVTRLGHFLIEFPLSPNLACSVIKATSVGCEDLLLPLAAMLSVEHIFIQSGILHANQHSSDPNLQ